MWLAGIPSFLIQPFPSSSAFGVNHESSPRAFFDLRLSQAVPSGTEIASDSTALLSHSFPRLRLSQSGTELIAGPTASPRVFFPFLPVWPTSMAGSGAIFQSFPRVEWVLCLPHSGQSGLTVGRAASVVRFQSVAKLRHSTGPASRLFFLTLYVESRCCL